MTRGDDYILLTFFFFLCADFCFGFFSSPSFGGGVFWDLNSGRRGPRGFLFSVKDEDGNEWKFIHERLFLFGFLRLAGRISFGSVFSFFFV